MVALPEAGFREVRRGFLRQLCLPSFTWPVGASVGGIAVLVRASKKRLATPERPMRLAGELATRGPSRTREQEQYPRCEPAQSRPGGALGPVRRAMRRRTQTQASEVPIACVRRGGTLLAQSPSVRFPSAVCAHRKRAASLREARKTMWSRMHPLPDLRLASQEPKAVAEGYSDISLRLGRSFGPRSKVSRIQVFVQSRFSSCPMHEGLRRALVQFHLVRGISWPHWMRAAARSA